MIEGLRCLSLTDGSVLCFWARHINSCLVLVQPRKTHPDMTKNVDWDVKNQINPKIFFNKHFKLECKWFGSRSGLTFCLGQTLRSYQQRSRSSLAGKMFRESSIQIRNNLDTKILNKFLSFRLNKFWVLKKPSHGGGSFEYPKHMLNKFWVLKKPPHWDGSFEYPKHTLNKFLVLKTPSHWDGSFEYPKHMLWEK